MRLPAKKLSYPSDSEVGSMMLMFGFIVLPFLFFIFSSALDLNGYFLAKEQAKRFVDEGSMRAWKFLPNQQLARKAIEESARLYGLSAEDYTASIKNGDVTVEYLKAFPLWFSRYFDDSFQLPIKSYAVATGTPFETTILLDTSRYLAPPTGDSWGTSSEWGAARFFLDHTELGAGLPATPLEHTQHCFNPVFSPLKEAAINLHEFLSSFGRNAISIGYFPANGFEVEELRPLGRGGRMPVSSQDPSMTLRGEARFVNQAVSGVNFPSWCAAAASMETNFASYRFPGAQEHPVFTPKPTTQNIVTSGGYSFNPGYAENLSVRESLWSTTVSDRIQNTTEGIYQGVGQLLQGGGVTNGGLTGQEVKTLLVLSGGFPHNGAGSESDEALSSTIETVAKNIRDQRDIDLRIFYVVVYSPEIFPDKSSFDRHFDLLATAINEKLKEAHADDQSFPENTRLSRRYDFQVVKAGNAGAALSELVGQLMLVRRNSLLAQ